MNILFVGLSGVPYSKRAMDIRLLSFANLFAELKHDVIILNRYANGFKVEDCDMPINDNVKVCEILSGNQAKVKNSRLLLLWSILIEPFVLLNLNRRQKIDVVHCSSGHFVDLLAYRFLCMIINAKLVYQSCEFRGSYRTESIYHRLNGYLLAKYAAYLGHGAICISKFLVEHTRETRRGIKLVKIPPIADYKVIEAAVKPLDRKGENRPFLMFCGNAEDRELTDIIIDAYRKSVIRKTCALLMVLRGTEIEIAELKKKLPEMKILQNIDYDDLIQLYAEAQGLFIPMRDNIRDLARFPNKICEYSVAKGIIITTKYGEIPHYFEDKVNAIIADDFSADSISKKLDWLNENSHHLDYMRRNVFETGKQHFDLCSYKNEMSVFLASVLR